MGRLPPDAGPDMSWVWVEAARGLCVRLVFFTEMRAHLLAASCPRNMPLVGMGQVGFLIVGTQPPQRAHDTPTLSFRD